MLLNKWQSCQNQDKRSLEQSHIDLFQSELLTSHMLQVHVKSQAFIANSSQVQLVFGNQQSSHAQVVLLNSNQQNLKSFLQFIMKDHLQLTLSEFNYINRTQELNQLAKKLWRYIRSANMQFNPILVLTSQITLRNNLT